MYLSAAQTLCRSARPLALAGKGFKNALVFQVTFTGGRSLDGLPARGQTLQCHRKQERTVNARTQSTDMPHWPRIRVVRLWDVLNRAKDWNDLCQWFIANAGSGRYQMYWEVPCGYIVRFGSRHIFGGYGEPATHAAEPPLPPDGAPLPRVKLVRLAPAIEEQVAQQAYRTGAFVKPAIPADRFPGGLSIPDNAGGPPGLLEVLPVSAELHIQLLNPSATNAWEMMDVDPTNVYVDDDVFDEISQYLGSTPNAQSATDAVRAAKVQHEVREVAPSASSGGVTLSATVQTTPTVSAQVATAPKTPDDDSSVTESLASPSVHDAPQNAPIENSDPYGLKGRADAIYVLYQVAEQCSRTASFGSEPNAKKRHSSADTLLLNIIENNRWLRQKVFKDTRRAQAIKLIDTHRDPKSGSKLAKNRTWPTHAADEILSKPDARRQPFMNNTLELVIHVTKRWIDEVPDDRGSKSRLEALDKLLTEYGLDLPVERNTLFPIITWNGVRCWPAPEAARQSTSRAVGARHALPRHGA